MNKIFWTDFHTNLHSKHVAEIEGWYEFAREMIDFWSPCYYPYIIKQLENGFHLEAEQPETIYNEDYNKIKTFLAKKEKQDGYIGYASYEWQGSGEDGDHNIFHRDFSQDMFMPRRYKQLTELVKRRDTIMIPHHTGYAPGHRGKNWETHDEELSPIMEIYSSHGCSESDQSPIPLNVHIHMGPREDRGTAMSGLNKYKKKIGFMCSGDNHIAPAISGNGLMAVVCEEYDKDKLFNSMLNRQVYGVTRSKIQLDYKINETQMGGELKAVGDMNAQVHVIGTNAIDRIEFLQNGIVLDNYTHSGKYEDTPLGDDVKVKFEVEFGWGPDVRIFKDIYEKIWNFNMSTNAKIIDVEKLYTSPGSEILKEETNNFSAKVKTTKEGSGNGKLSQKNYLTPYIRNQSFIFEVQGKIDEVIKFEVDETAYEYTIAELLEETKLNAQYAEIKKLIKERYGVEDYYRSDPFWHNAYKFKIHKAVTSKAYDVKTNYTIKQKTDFDNVMVKVYQKNGDIAWSSPIWITD